MARVSIIVAASENNVIGNKGEIPWKLGTDLRRFCGLTMQCPVIMGRKTWESFDSTLPGRVPIVLSHDPFYFPYGVLTSRSLRSALAITEHYPEVFIAGGREVYDIALPIADTVYLTRVHATVKGDVVLPMLLCGSWHLASSAVHPASGVDQYPFTFETWIREWGTAI